MHSNSLLASRLNLDDVHSWLEIIEWSQKAINLIFSDTVKLLWKLVGFIIFLSPQMRVLLELGYYKMANLINHLQMLNCIQLQAKSSGRLFRIGEVAKSWA